MLNNPFVPLTDLPVGLKGQSYSRIQTSTLIALTSGRLVLTAIPVRAGTLVSSLSFISSTTGLSGGTNGWAALFDPSLNLLGQSADAGGAIAWAANSYKSFALASPVIVPSDGLYLAGVMIAATTPPSLVGVNPANGGVILVSQAPALGGQYNTGLTTTAPATASGFSASVLPWAGYA